MKIDYTKYNAVKTCDESHPIGLIFLDGDTVWFDTIDNRHRFIKDNPEIIAHPVYGVD